MTVATNVIATNYELNSSKFVAGAGQANRAVDSLIRGNLSAQNAVQGLRSSLLGIGGGAALAAAALAGVGIALGAVVNKAIGLGEELQRMSNRTGESVEALSRLKFAAEQEDVSLGQVSQALRVVSQRAVAAARGNKEAGDSFKRLGVDVKDANGNLKSGTVLLEEIGRGLNRLPAGTERTAAAVEVLGRSGQSLIPLVTNLGALNARAEELGLTIGPQFAADADEFGDRMDELKAVTARLGVEVASVLLPILNDFLRLMTDALVPILQLLKEHSDDLAFSLFKTGKAFQFAGFLGFGFAKAVGRDGPISAAKQLLEEYEKTLGTTREQWEGLRAQQSPAAAIEETGTAAETAAKSLATLNRELAAQATQFAAEEFAPRGREVPGAPGQVVGEPLEPIALQGVESTISASATQAEAFAQFMSDARVQAELLNTPLEEARQSFEGFNALAGGFTEALISSAQGAKTAFQDFFKSLLANLAKAIIRALVLRAILSIFGGVPSIGKILGTATGQAQGALGFQDQESSMLGRASQARSLGIGGTALAGASGLPTPNVTVTPRVVVNQATPATWVQITDEQIMPRLRTRQRRLNDDLR